MNLLTNKKWTILLCVTMLWGAIAYTITPVSACQIPASGPWPDCAKRGEATNIQKPTSNNTDDCVIPNSGPWPPCATGGNNKSNKQESEENCVIPMSGPWPPCATSGAISTTPVEKTDPESEPTAEPIIEPTVVTTTPEPTEKMYTRAEAKALAHNHDLLPSSEDGFFYHHDSCSEEGNEYYCDYSWWRTEEGKDISESDFTGSDIRVIYHDQPVTEVTISLPKEIQTDAFQFPTDDAGEYYLISEDKNSMTMCTNTTTTIIPFRICTHAEIEGNLLLQYTVVASEFIDAYYVANVIDLIK